MPNFATSVRVGRHRDEVLGDGGLVAPEPGEAPLARAAGVGERLQRGERLRRDHEQRLGGVEVVGGFPEVGAVDVAHEPERHVALREVAQRVVGHVRSEVGAADADVDDVADALAGVADPLPAAHALGEVGHLAQHRVHRGDDVLAVDLDHRALGRAQRGVQHGAVLGDVDLLAPEHGVDAVAQAAPARASSTRRRRVSSVTRFLE